MLGRHRWAQWLFQIGSDVSAFGRSPPSLTIGRASCAETGQLGVNLGWKFVARNRPWLASAFGALLIWHHGRVHASLPTHIAAAFALAFVTVQNVLILSAAELRLPGEFKAVRQFLGRCQFWTMFAPYPELNTP